MNILVSVDNHYPCLNQGCKMVILLVLLLYELAFSVRKSSSYLPPSPTAVFSLLLVPPVWLPLLRLLPEAACSVADLDTSMPCLKSLRDKLTSVCLAQGSPWSGSCLPLWVHLSLYPLINFIQTTYNSLNTAPYCTPLDLCRCWSVCLQNPPRPSPDAHLLFQLWLTCQLLWA